MIEVHYSCDILGDHKAFTQKLIDTEIKKFKYLSDALTFASECTECINYSALLQKAGVSEEMSKATLEEGLLLDSEEYSRYKE